VKDIHINTRNKEPRPMSTAPNVNATVSPREGLMAWARGVEDWLDARGRKAWFIAMILGFIFVWPVGLALLAYMIWSKRMFNHSCAKHAADRGSNWGGHSRHWGRHFGEGNPFRSSGNAAFDAYKAETLRRLMDEQAAFEAFLQRLREAKDKSEFDSFMADRARATQTDTAQDSVKGEDTARSGEY
jgi:Protein of unknown function (DUF2852)